MQKYFGWLQKRGGPALAGAVVSVETYPGGVPVTLYSDDGVTVIPLLATDEDGYYEFFIALGTYDLVFTYEGAEYKRIQNVVMGEGGDSASFAATLAASGGSNLVGFLQSGTGAVTRTVQSKLRDFASVKDFGAVGDGVVDDTAAFTTSLEFPGRVAVVAGSYNLASDITGNFVLDAGITWTGTGRVKLIERGFFTNVAGGVNVHKFRDRVQVGDCTDYACTQFSGNSAIAEDMGRYFERDSTLSVASPNGMIAIMGMTRADDQDGSFSGAGNRAPIAIAGVAKNGRGNTFNNGVWAGYFEGTREQTDGGVVYGLEIVSKNCGTDSTLTGSPYSSGGYFGQKTTVGIWLRSGGDDAYGGVPAGDSMAGLIIGGKMQDATQISYKKGIIFTEYAVSGTDGVTGNGVAVEMAKGHQIVWRFGSGSSDTGGLIRSDATDATTHARLIFTDTGLEVCGSSSEKLAFKVQTTATAANYVQVLPGATGVRALVRALGEANASLGLRPNGTGSISLERETGAKIVEVNSTGLGFFAASPVAKQTVTGSKGANAALGSLLTALATYGLVTDSSS